MKPRLIELKGYVKNFKDGTITEHVKMKPMTGYRGRTTVQLFNAETGELEQEVMSENVINNWIAKDSFDSNFRGQVNNHKTSLFANPFSYLLLSDAAVPESADAKELVGRMYGWASRDTYSGSAINRGTLNTAESWYSNRATAGKTQAHLVFDFPTHAANGTIRTIYWAPSALQVTAVAEGGQPWTGIKRCTNWYYENYPVLSFNTQVPFEQQQVLSYRYMYAVPSMQGRVNMTTKMFYGVTNWESALCFSAVDIDRFNLSASDIVKCTYTDGSVYTSYPTIMAVHIDPAAQLFKILFWTGSSTSYKDMPLQCQFYEVTFNFSGTTQSVKSFNRSLLMDGTRYPNNYSSSSSNGWYYKNDGSLCLVDSYTTPSTNPTEYENYEFQLNSAFTAVNKVDTRPILVNCLNERWGVTTYTVTDPLVKQSRLQYISWVKDDVICYYVSSSSITGQFIVRRSDGVCLYHSADWYIPSGQNYYYYYYYGSNTLINYYYYSSRIGCWFGQFTMLPSAQNLLPSNVVKTDVNTMKIQYDFIIDENDFVTDYVPNGGK